MRQLIPVIVAGTIFSGASQADIRHRTDWGPSSLRLVEGMTEEEAIKAVGQWPSKAEVTTCGSESSSGEWTCRILTFGDRYSSLRIFERRDDQWVVNNWSVDD
jgi:hypothetical protein